MSNSRHIVTRSLSILWITIILSSYHTRAQNISFNTIGLHEGLSEISALAIHQDHLKRMWFGTRHGLNCWDGVRMKHFYPTPGDTTSLMENKVVKLLQQEQYLWVQTSNGLSRLDLETMTFKRFSIPGILSITIYDNNLIAGTRTGILNFDEHTSKFKKDTNFSELNNTVSVVYTDNSNNLWLALEETNQIMRVSDGNLELIDLPVHTKLNIFDLLVSSQNKLYVATRYHGIIVYDLLAKKFDFINKTSTPYRLNDLSVRSIKEDREGNLYVGTFQGLALFDLINNTCKFIQDLNDNEYSLSHNSIHCLYISDDNYLWIGTYFGGINYGRISNEIFKKYNDESIRLKSSYPVIGPIIEDSQNNVWIGTEGGGLDYLDRNENIFKNYSHVNSRNSLSQSNVKSLYLKDNDKLLIGTYQGGLNILDLSSDQISHYDDSSIKNAPKHVNAIISFKKDFLLASEKGVIRFNIETQKFTPFFDFSDSIPETSEVVSTLYRDSEGVIWIGLEFSGLLSFNPETGELRKYKYNEFDIHSVPYNSINCIMEDHLFRLWIGTDGGGFCMYNRKDDNFIRFDKKQNNLPSDFIYGFAKSRFGNLWISTSKGLSRFDVENNIFYNYEYKSGFPLEELNYRALLLTKEGELFVGGVDGLISFQEEDLLLTKENQEIIFSDLEVNNKIVKVNDGSDILSKDIGITEFFSLKPGQNVFKIYFSTCNYNSVLKNKFQYMLEGFDEEWINAEYNSMATYTNLDAGKYRFKVRGTDVIYNPVTEQKTIQVNVIPPFYKTTYAYIIYILFILTLIVIFNFFYLTREKLAEQLRFEREDKKRMNELNKYKNRFLSHISHEFMTPLTVLLGSLESLYVKQKNALNYNSPLTLAYNNARRLKNLSSELFDYHRLEQERLRMHINEYDIVHYLNDVSETFRRIALDNEVYFSYRKSTDHLKIFYDPAQLDRVFNNLLIQAIENTVEHSGKIELSLEEKEKYISISVFHNGKVLPYDSADVNGTPGGKVNPLEYTNISLALSKKIVLAHKGEFRFDPIPEKGNVFTIILYKGKAHFQSEEITDQLNSKKFDVKDEFIFHDYKDGEVVDVEPDNKSSKRLDAPLMLIVDDNREIRLILQKLFEDRFRIELAADGQQGFDKAFELKPDIVISELTLPKLSGNKMCSMLKRNNITSHVLVLFLTSHDSEEDQISAFSNGADGYCTKPFNSDMLRTMVTNLFKNRLILEEKMSKDVQIKTISENLVDKEFLARIHDIVEQNIALSDFSIDEFSKEMGLSRTLFFNKVKSITGKTPNNYIQEIRLKKAADMLLFDPTKNISEIAYENGFNSLRYFSMCFKKYFGVTPSVYVQKHSKLNVE